MPATLIETRVQRSPEQNHALMMAVHQALREGFRIPQDDLCIRLVTHAPQQFLAPPRCAQPELFTLITIDAFAGRSTDARRALFRAMADRLHEQGIPRDHFNVIIHDVPRESWGLSDGRAASDVDLGFKVDI